MAVVLIVIIIIRVGIVIVILIDVCAGNSIAILIIKHYQLVPNISFIGRIERHVVVLIPLIDVLSVNSAVTS